MIARDVALSSRASVYRRRLTSARYGLSCAVAWVDRHATILALFGSISIVFALYGRALGFSFLFDDPFDLTRVEGRGYWSLLSSSQGYSYYRPIPFLLWKGLRALQGQYHEPTLHALPLIAHALAGWLFFVLVRRLGASNWAILPAILFLTYPFHYQAVAVAGTLFHPLVGAAILGSMTLYHMARSAAGRQAIALHSAALAASLVALWSHESGVAIAPLVALLELVIVWRHGLRRPSPWVSGHMVAAIAFVLVWSTVARSPSGDQATTADLHPKTMFFAQGFIWPFTAQINAFEARGVPVPGIVELSIAALGLVLGAFGIAAWRTGRRALPLVPLIGLAVALAASVPAMLKLSWAYVENAPRLLYLVGMGAALFWGLLPALDFRARRVTLIWRVATIALLLGVVVQSWRFVDARMRMWEVATSTVNAIVAHGEAYRGRDLLVVNAPSWFSQNRYEYLYGHYGVQIVPTYIGLDRIIYASSVRQTQVGVSSVAWFPEIGGPPYPFGPHGVELPAEQLDALVREGREVIDVRPGAGGFVVRDAGRLRPGKAERRADAAGRIGEVVWLDRARFVSDGDSVVAWIVWNVMAPPGNRHETVVELRDMRGVVVFNARGGALGGVSTPGTWRAGDRVDDAVALPLPPSGRFTLYAGLQIADGDARLEAFDDHGRNVADGLVSLGEIVVKPDSTIEAVLEP